MNSAGWVIVAGLVVIVAVKARNFVDIPGMGGDPNYKLERAAGYGEQGDFPTAVRLASEVIDAHPSNALAYSLRGTAQRRAGNYLQAMADLNESIKLDPGIAESYIQRAWAAQQAGIEAPDRQVLRDLDKAIELDPTISLAFIVQGNEHAEFGRAAAAIASYDQALILNPQSYSALGGRALAKMSRGELDDAKQDLRKALTFNPPAGDRRQLEQILKEAEAAR